MHSQIYTLWRGCALLICFPATLLAAPEPVNHTQPAPKQTLIHAVGDAYLKSFLIEQGKDASDQSVTEPTQTKKAKKSKRLDLATLKAVQLSDHMKRTLVFNEVFAHSNTCNHFVTTTLSILNGYSWKDLHLFHGTTTSPHFSLMARLNRTDTILGEGALALFLAKPTTDIPLLRGRQKLLELLIKEPSIYQTLRQPLAAFKEEETSMLSFWSATDPLYTKEYIKYMQQRFYTQKQHVNESAASLEWRKRLKRDFFGITWNFTSHLFYGHAFYGIGKIFNAKTPYKDSVRDWIPVYNLYHAISLLGNKNLDSVATALAGVMKDSSQQDINEKYMSDMRNAAKAIAYTKSTLSIIKNGFWLWNCWNGYSNYKEYSDVLRSLALRMASVQTFLHTLEKVSATVAAHPTLQDTVGPQLTATRKLLSLAKEQGEIGELIKNLKTLPFKSWSYFFSHAGKLLASHTLFVKHKAIFHDAMFELGQLDALLGISTLMQDMAKTEGHGYHFVQFLSRQKQGTPYINIKEMWNPFLTPEVAVGNSITMGKDKGMRNMILTGPNAGGKSTFLTGVAYTLLLGQVFGIVPAERATFTPFNHLNTYIDIADDIAAGKSLFMAEVERFQQHLNLLEPLGKHQFSFTIFDEPFSGTNPIEGAAAEYSVLNYIAKYENTLNIVATHYPIVMLLEKRSPQKGFRNYKVFIKYTQDRKIQYQYKIVPGASNQAIALDILSEQGYAPEMLAQARDIIEHPDRYHKTFS